MYTFLVFSIFSIGPVYILRIILKISEESGMEDERESAARNLSCKLAHANDHACPAGPFYFPSSPILAIMRPILLYIVLDTWCIQAGVLRRGDEIADRSSDKWEMKKEERAAESCKKRQSGEESLKYFANNPHFPVMTANRYLVLAHGRREPFWRTRCW